MNYAKHNNPVFVIPNKHTQTMFGLFEGMHSKTATEQHCLHVAVQRGMYRHVILNSPATNKC